MNTITDIKKDKTAKREELLGDMTEDAREMFLDIENKLVNEDLDTINNRYDIGCMVLRATNNPNKYGKEIHKTFAELLDMNPDVVYQTRLVASRFNNDDKNRILDMRNGLNQPITWTQLVAVARITDEKARWDLLDRTIENNWNTKDLDNEINMNDNKTTKTTAKAPSKKLGRPISKPKDLNSLLTQLESMTKKMYKACSNVWLSKDAGLASMVEEVVEDTGPEEKLVTRLAANSELLRELIDSMTELAGELDSSITKIQEAMPSEGSPSPNVLDGPYSLIDSSDTEEVDEDDDDEEGEPDQEEVDQTIKSARTPSKM